MNKYIYNFQNKKKTKLAARNCMKMIYTNCQVSNMFTTTREVVHIFFDILPCFSLIFIDFRVRKILNISKSLEIFEKTPTWRCQISMTTWSTSKNFSINSIYISRTVDCAMFWVGLSRPNGRVESMNTGEISILTCPAPPWELTQKKNMVPPAPPYMLQPWIGSA